MEAPEARARLSVLSDLEASLAEMGLHWNGVVRDAIDRVRSKIIADAGDAVAHICMPCCGPIMVGDKMQWTTDSEPLCEACAFTWGDIREQWAEIAQNPLTDEDRSTAALTLQDYVAHIDAGGSPDDKPLIVAEAMR